MWVRMRHNINISTTRRARRVLQAEGGPHIIVRVFQSQSRCSLLHDAKIDHNHRDHHERDEEKPDARRECCETYVVACEHGAGQWLMMMMISPIGEMSPSARRVIGRFETISGATIAGETARVFVSSAGRTAALKASASEMISAKRSFCISIFRVFSARSARAEESVSSTQHLSPPPNKKV